MTDPESHNAAQRLTFGRYVLDLHRGILLLDNREIALQPKTFAVLKYLAARPGRLVSADELHAAVWPAGGPANDALAQSIAELRRALGESGAQLITVAERGYQFDADAAPPDRRKSRQSHPLRWRWIYGILAPLALLLTFLVLWLSD